MSDMVAYCTRHGVPYEAIMKMDVLRFCALHDRMYRGELFDLARNARVAQFSAQGDGKQLNEVLAPIDDMTGETERRQQDDLGKLKSNLRKGGV